MSGDWNEQLERRAEGLVPGYIGQDDQAAPAAAITGNLETIVTGLAAGRPAANAYRGWYFSSDTGALEHSDGATWEALQSGTSVPVSHLQATNIEVDGIPDGDSVYVRWNPDSAVIVGADLQLAEFTPMSGIFDVVEVLTDGLYSMDFLAVVGAPADITWGSFRIQDASGLDPNWLDWGATWGPVDPTAVYPVISKTARLVAGQQFALYGGCSGAVWNVYSAYVLFNRIA